MRLVLTSAEDAHRLANLWGPYANDISSHDGQLPNAHGVFVDRPEASSCDTILTAQRAWWSNPQYLFPYLIEVDGRAVGFNMISSGPYLPSQDLDFCVHEFFLVGALRGTGLAARAAREGIAKHRGRWEVVTYPTADRPIGFWRKTLPTCAHGEVRETLDEQHPWGSKVVFRFENGEA